MQTDKKAASAPGTPKRQPMRWARLSLYIAGTLIASLVITGIWWLNDNSRVKALTERVVSSLTGRTLAIGGAFNFHLGQEISVSAENVSWANAAWGHGPAMLSIGLAEFSVDLRSILQPPLLITRIVARDAQLNFEWNAEDQSNWQLGKGGGDKKQNSKQPFRWVLEQADLQNVNLSIRLAAQNDELRIHVQDLKQKQSELDLYPGQEMTVAATGLNLTNPAWVSEPLLLNIAAVEATFDFDSIMKAPLVVSDLSASDAQLNLEWNADGGFNWRLGAAKKMETEESAHPLALVLDKANVQRVDLRIVHPAQTETLMINVAQATQQQDKDAHLMTDIDATIDGQPLNLDGRIGPFPELLAAGPIDFDLTLKGAGATLSFAGDIANLARMQAPRLSLEWSSADVGKVFDLFNIPAAASGKAELRGSVTPVGEGIDGQISGSVGEFDVNGSLHTDSMNQLKGLSLDKLNGLAVSFQSSGPSAQSAGKIIAIDGLPPEPYQLDIKMQDADAGLQIEALRFATAGAVATGSGLVHDFPSLARLDFDLQMNVPNIARFSGLLPGHDIPALPLRVDGKIRGNTNGENDSVTATLKLGPLDAQLDGLLTEKLRFAGSTFGWTLAVSDARKIATIFDFKMLQAVALNASGKADVSAAELGLRDTVVKLGSHTAKLSGKLPLSAGDEPLELEGSVNGTNLQNLVSLFATAKDVPALPYDLSGQYRYGKAKLSFPSVTGTLGTSQLQASGSLLFGKGWPVTDLKLSAKGPHLEELLRQANYAQRPTGDYTASGALKLSSGGTELSQLNMQTDSGLVKGSLALGWPADPDRIDFDVTASGKNLRKILPAIDGYEPAAVAFNISARGKLVKQRVDIPLLTGTVGKARINVQGNLDFGATMHSDGATLEVSGPNIEDLGRMAKWQWQPPAAPFDFSASLAGAADKLNFSQLRLKYGSSDLQGSMTLSRQGKPRIDIIARSRQIDARPFLSLLDDEPATAPVPSVTQKAAKTKTPKPLLPDVSVPVKLLNSFDGSLKLSVSKFISRRILLDDLNVTGALANGNFDFDGSSTFSNGGYFQLAFDLLQQKDRVPHVEFSTTSKDAQYQLNQLDPSLQGYNLFQNMDAYLTGDGVTLREIVGTFDGYLWLRGGAQKIASTQFGFLFGDFLTGVISAINPFIKKEPYQNVQCATAFFEATNGVLKTSPAMLLSTDKLNIGATGTINLKSERIELNVHADPRTGIGISASSLINPFVALRGTLSDPQFSLDPTGTLIQGGAALATGGLSIVAGSLYKRWFGARDPCKKLAEEARAARTKQDPKHVPAD